MCYSLVESIHVVEYFEENIMNDDTMAILESWLLFFGNLWNMDARWTLLSSLINPQLPISISTIKYIKNI